MCDSLTLAFLCVKCEVWLCEECSEKHTQLKGLKSHALIPFRDKLAQEKSTLAQTVCEKKSDLQQIEKIFDKVLTAKNDTETIKIQSLEECDKIELQICHEIHEKIDQFREKIRKVLFAKVESDYQSKLENISRQLLLLEKYNGKNMGFV